MLSRTLSVVLTLALAVALAQAQNAGALDTGAQPPLRIFLRGGPKTHGPGEHDHPRFVEDWKPLLEQRGALVEGGLEFPSAEQLARTDVLVLYAAEGASIHGQERAHLEAYLARGAGLAVLHDAVCGDDPEWFKSVAGGAWEHGRSNYHTDPIDLYVSELADPITDGLANFRFEDEIYWDLQLVPEAKVLLNSFHTVFDIKPQAWTYAPGNYRAFVSLQGHYSKSFEHHAFRSFLLRGIAWAGKRPVDSLLLPGEAAALRYPLGGPTRPELAQANLQLHPDFQAQLVAAEPLVVNPIAVDWDARGRLWVALTHGYPDKERFSGRAARDELVILEQPDASGRMQRRKSFYQGLDLVTGFVFHRDGVIASSAPELVWLRDTDGDDVADTREVVFSGFGFGDTHAVMSNLRWGPDGWIYATQGYSGGASNHIQNAAGRDFGQIGNGLFRFRPDGSAIEMIARYGSNTWGCSFSPAGDLFFSMANGAHLRQVVLPERFLDGNRVAGVESWVDLPDHQRVFPAVVRTEAPYAQIDFVGGFTGAAGSAVYDGGAWPEPWNSAHFVCEPTVNLVHHDVLTPKGVSFRASKAREPEFLTSTDLWFRPVDVRVGPDGALYVLDFYNQAAVHNDTRGPQHGPTNAALRPDRDHEHGRIWRVQHREARLLARPQGELDAQRDCALLLHPNAALRRSVQRLLLEEPTAVAPAELHEVFERARLAPFASVELPWTMQLLGCLDAAAADSMLDSGDALCQRTLARIAAEAPQALAALAPGLAGLLGEQRRQGLDDATRLALVNALAALPPTEQGLAVLLALWPAVEDPWTKSALLRGLAQDLPWVLRAPAAEEELEGRAELLGLLTGIHLREQGPTGADSALAALLRPGLAAQLRLAVLQALVSDSKPASAPAPQAGTRDALAQLLADEDARIATAALPLATRLGLQTQLAAECRQVAERLLAQLEDQEQPHSARVQALAALLSLPESRAAALAAAETLLQPALPPEAQLAALDALAGTEAIGAAACIASAYGSLGGRARERAFELLNARAAWAACLLDRIEAKEISKAELGPQKVHRLRNHADAAIAARAGKLFASLAGASNAQVETLIASLLPEVDRPGNREAGRQVFEKNCAACHTAFGAGGRVGPDLSGMGAHGARDLLPIILDPNRAVEAAYAEWVVTTVDERLVSGVLVRESEASVLLRSSAGDVEIQRDEIAELRNTGRSPMPAGFESLGAAGLRDLIAYLAGDFAGFRILDIDAQASSSTLAGLYDRARDGNPMLFRRYGVQEIDGVPYELLDPRHTESACNAIVLKGGLVPDWESKLEKPQRVELDVGAALESVHVLGGIAGWGFPYIKETKPIVAWTWNYADGSDETVVLHNGVEFADWIAHHDVPGSRFVEGLLTDDSWGQVRSFEVVPKEHKPVRSITLESFDNELAPTFLALSARLLGTALPKRPALEPQQIVIVGGGSSHDFGANYRDLDRATLERAGLPPAAYLEPGAELLQALQYAKVLVLACNQELPGDSLREALFDFVARGGGLVSLHAATWYNWADWPAYNAVLVGGGARSHEGYAAFEVRLAGAGHALLDSVPAVFEIEDELYRFEPDAGTPVLVLATGHSLSSGASFPVAWSLTHGKGRIVGLTLGHDQAAHANPAYQTLLVNAVRWTLQP